MDIDELKNETRKVKAPDVATLDYSERVRTVDGLVDELKRRDAAEKKRIRFSMIIFGSVGIVIAALALRGGADSATRLGRGLLALIYFLLVALSAIKAFILGKVDYAEPTLAFLKKAEKRYRFIGPWEYLCVIPGLVVAGYAGWLLTVSEFNDLAHPARAATFDLFYVLGFLALCALGFFFSRKNWKRDKGPLHDRLTAAVRDFGE